MNTFRALLVALLITAFFIVGGVLALGYIVLLAWEHGLCWGCYSGSERVLYFFILPFAILLPLFFGSGLLWSFATPEKRDELKDESSEESSRFQSSSSLDSPAEKESDRAS